MASGGKTALKQFEAENMIKTVANIDEIYKFDRKSQQQVLQSKPWLKDPHYFKEVKISALALLKMVMHARSGVPVEVMGLMQGKIDGNCFVVMDAFALPVEGTETRVDAAQEAIEYMSQYVSLIAQVGREENVVGWYHSHPGYGCWMSGVDCSTQMNNQKYQDPFLAIVVDPVRTVSAGKVELGAFRTYPEGYKPPEDASTSSSNEYQSIPMNKIEDFGVHAKQYYALEVSYFKSSTDTNLLNLLWNKYWINTLSSSPIISNRNYISGQIFDLGEKMERAEAEFGHSRSTSGGLSSLYAMSGEKGEGKRDQVLSKIDKDSSKLSIELLSGMITEVTKDCVFNFRK